MTSSKQINGRNSSYKDLFLTEVFKVATLLIPAASFVRLYF